MWLPSFTDKKAEAQEGLVTCPRLLRTGLEVLEPRPKARAHSSHALIHTCPYQVVQPWSVAQALLGPVLCCPCPVRTLSVHEKRPGLSLQKTDGSRKEELSRPGTCRPWEQGRSWHLLREVSFPFGKAKGWEKNLLRAWCEGRGLVVFVWCKVPARLMALGPSAEHSSMLRGI